MHSGTAVVGTSRCEIGTTHMIALIFLLSLLFPPAPLIRDVRVVFVEPAGESFNHPHATAAQSAIESAMAFWQGHAQLVIVSTSIISLTGDTFGDLTWSLPMLAPNGPVTIFVLDNTLSNARLPGGDVGDAQDYWGAIWVCQFGDVLPAVLAHELGHVLFGLPDWYRVPDACAHPDIMCDHVAAFQRGFIGCQSLAFIGTSCHAAYLPRIS